MLERDIQNKIINLIEEEQFQNSIKGVDLLKAEQDGIENNSFDLDNILKKKNLSNYLKVFDDLSLLDIISADKNISSVKKEILRPDIICFNPETNSFTIIEIKKDGQTEREAITELLAYQQEVKNICPLISDNDINFILIAKEWNTLLRHSVENINSWGNKKILPIKLKIDGDNLELNVGNTNAWNNISLTKFPENSLATVTMCLYPKECYDPKTIDDNLKKNALWAVSMIAEILDKNNYHGVVFLCDSPNSLCKWQITIICFNGLSLLNYINFEKPILDEIGLDNLITDGEIPPNIYLPKKDKEHYLNNSNYKNNELIKFFYENRYDYFSDQLPFNIHKLLVSPRKYLSNFFNPEVEAFIDWGRFKYYFSDLYDENYYDSKFNIFPRPPHLYPQYCKCYGLLSEFIYENINLLLDDKITDSYVTDPTIIFEFIKNITHKHIGIDFDDEE